MKRTSNAKSVKWGNGKTFVNSKQSSRASVGQGGNAFAINASEIAVVRVRPGQ